ncbi:hypothetical protein BH11CYA1_BH11CYA1_29150 [soil metagenome]
MDKQSGNDNKERKPADGEIAERKGEGSSGSQLNAADILFDKAPVGKGSANKDNLDDRSNVKDPLRLPAASDKVTEEPPIGVAQLKENETIVLHIKGKTGDLTGEAEVEYKLGDKLYDEVYKHLGGIKKGETKLVPAWLDDPFKSDKAGQKPARQSTTDGPKAAEQEPVKELPKEPADATLDKNGNAIDVVLPPSLPFVANVTDTYGKMSPEVHDLLDKEKTVVTPARRITDALPELKGQKPRGWPPGLTWDAVDGAYSPSRNLVVVAEETRDTSNNWVKSHRTEDVTRHEVGHATDYAMGKFSDTKDYIQAYEDDTKAMPSALTGTLKYFLQSGDGGKEEAFAEGVAAREGGSTSGKVFESGFAKSIAVINDALLLRRAKLPNATSAVPTPTGTSPKPDTTNKNSK